MPGPHVWGGGAWGQPDIRAALFSWGPDSTRTRLHWSDRLLLPKMSPSCRIL